jgi:hypothetical protein
MVVSPSWARRSAIDTALAVAGALEACSSCRLGCSALCQLLLLRSLIIATMAIAIMPMSVIM